jgi:hypothetical protein
VTRSVIPEAAAGGFRDPSSHYFSPTIMELPPGNSRTLVLANPAECSQPVQSDAV